MKSFQFSFSQFTLFYRVECEKLFCKTNLKLKVLKLIKTKIMKSVLKSLLLIIRTNLYYVQIAININNAQLVVWC